MIQKKARPPEPDGPRAVNRWKAGRAAAEGYAPLPPTPGSPPPTAATPSASSTNKAQARRLFIGLLFLAGAVLVTAGLWLNHQMQTQEHGKVDKFRRYQFGFVAHLPRVSYLGAAPPAYYAFSVGMTIGVWIILFPFSGYLAKLYVLAVRLGVPQGANRFHCCCCCLCPCFDDERLAFHVDSEGYQWESAPSSPPRPPATPPVDEAHLAPACPAVCCGRPYLPYVVAALRPVFFAAMWGLVTLAVVSLDPDTPSRHLWEFHYVGAACFFWGMIALHGLVLFTRSELARLAPDKCRRVAGIDAASWRHRASVLLFKATIFVQVVVDWGSLAASLLLSTQAGDHRFTRFFFG